MISLVGELFSATVLSRFGNASFFVKLAFFIPLIMALGGNAGTQAASIVVRSIALGNIKFGKVWDTFLKEIRVGLAMGFFTGALVGIIGYVWQKDYFIGVTIGIAMFSAITVAATIGSLLPLFFNKFDIDPAVASGPFVTTINDITGLLIYFGVATFLHNIF